jgi:hypothetical protein
MQISLRLNIKQLRLSFVWGATLDKLFAAANGYLFVDQGGEVFTTKIITPQLEYVALDEII